MLRLYGYKSESENPPLLINSDKFMKLTGVDGTAQKQ